MGPGKNTVRGLVDEAKNRMMLLLICSFGLAYIMSLTSSSVWVNLPAAASLIIFVRYLSLDLNGQKHSVASDKQSALIQSSQKRMIELPQVSSEKSNWRRKVNSPLVEEAIDNFTRHITSEWVTDLWYSRITPDKDGPEALVQIINEVLGEISSRSRDVNLIDLLTSDIINIFCNNLELYRTIQSKVGQKELAKLPSDLRDTQLRLVLAADNSLHPGLFSSAAEHKVLQHLMSGLISFTFKPEDLQCSFFRYTARELLACAVMRPILNLANPRIINEKIESLAISFTNKAGKGVMHPVQGTTSEPSRPTAHQLSGFQDRLDVGVELMQLKQDTPNRSFVGPSKSNTNRILVSKDPQHSYPSLGTDFEKNNGQEIAVHKSGGDWGNKFDAIAQRKTQSLAPEHLENMWTRGRNYKTKDSGRVSVHQVAQKTVVDFVGTKPGVAANHLVRDTAVKNVLQTRNSPSSLEPEASYSSVHGTYSTYYNGSSNQEKTSNKLDQEESDSESSCASEDDENNNVTGLDSPGTRVWDSRSKAKISRIRHPLESSEAKLMKKCTTHGFHSRASKSLSGRRRPRPSNQKLATWQEIGKSSYLLDGNDMLGTPKGDMRKEVVSDDSETERWARAHNGTTSLSMSSILVTETCNVSTRSSEPLMRDDSFLKLRCEVLGANIVKSGSGSFAVYSIAVTDGDNNSWSIKRRFRHFEELHRLLKEFSEYNLHLPPKHFLSSGLELTVVRERCILLDKYLKKLLQHPTISRSIEVWDFLSVDSQTYIFSDSLSIVETISVDLDDKQNEKSAAVQNTMNSVNDLPCSKEKHLGHATKEYSSSNSSLKPESMSSKVNTDQHPRKTFNSDGSMQQDISGSDTETSHYITETVADPDIPNEWVPPNLSVHILDLVDVIFQLHDGGWIRRQAFWVAKQVLQLGMGDAFDDWLIQKIQLLRKGSIIASAIRRVEQILWPDGIFITKHPSRRRPTPQSSPREEGSPKNNRSENKSSFEREASRRAKFVHELIIDKAPVALVGLVGRKEYERCAQDVYNFLQSSVFLKQLAFELLELLLLAAFPELDDVVRRCHEDKGHFGKLEEQ